MTSRAAPAPAATKQDIFAWLHGLRFVAITGKNRDYHLELPQRSGRKAAIFALVPHLTSDNKIYVSLVAQNPTLKGIQPCRCRACFVALRPGTTASGHR